MKNLTHFNCLFHSLLLCLGIVWNIYATPLQASPSLSTGNIFIDAEVLDLEISQSQSSASFHLLTHGRPGELLIEGDWKQASEIAHWLSQQQLLEGYSHLNIYGCHFAQGEKGLATVEYLETALGVSVAASDDLTGIDGDWELEVGTAKNGLSIADYAYNLQPAATLPIQEGMAAITCGSNTESNGTGTDPNGYVFAIYDIREPDCPGNDAPNATDNWDAATNSVYHHPSWIAANLGEVFGIDLEYNNLTAPDIFLGANGITRFDADVPPVSGGTGGEIFRIDGTTGAISTLVSLPNTTFSVGAFTNFVGLGNVSYNADNQVVYATNMDDGNIYVVNAITGTTLQVLDPTPGIADDTNTSFTQLERLVMGIEFNICDKRVYFARPNATNPNQTQEIYSLGVNADGTLNLTDINLELSLDPTPPNSHLGDAFISDIEFSSDCSEILFSTRTLEETSVRLVQRTHKSPVLKYTLSGGIWTNSIRYSIGTFGSFHPHNNAGGGVDFGNMNYGACGSGVTNGCDDAMVATADALVFGGVGTNIYGILISDIAGNATGYPGNSYFVDLDGNTSGTSEVDKYTNFDVDVFRSSCLELCVISCTITSTTDISCATATDGSITAMGASTDPSITNFEYSRDGGSNWQSSGTFTGLTQGTYFIMVRDGDGNETCGNTCKATLGCANETTTNVTVTIPVSFANASSSGGNNAGNMVGGPLATSASSSNSTQLTNGDPEAVLVFDNTLPIGTSVTVSLGRDNNAGDADITYGTSGSVSWTVGGNDVLVHATFTLTEAVSQITVTRTDGRMWVDGASHESYDVTGPVTTCDACPACMIDADGLANVACGGTDAISLDLNPTGTGLATTYNISVSGGGATSISPTTANYGAATTFTLNNNSAGGGDVIITITDATDGACTRMVTVTDPGTCAPTCSITADGLVNVACGGTDAISLDLNPTGTDIGTMYNVSVSGGGATSISPTTANYGAATTFTLNDNSAGGGDVTITLTDVTDGTCTRMVTVTDPGACVPTCPAQQCGTVTITINNN